MYLTIFFAILPIFSTVLFCASPMPNMKGEGERLETVVVNKKRRTALALCFACIFLGACAETVMTSWISGYVETALGIDKILGDVLGLALFALLLGFTRIGFAKFGKNIQKTLLIGMIGASVCYLIVGFSPNNIVSLIFCVFTGPFVAMLWPGTLIMMEEKVPHVGVASFALMAAGGDFGAAVAPQIMGVVIDGVSSSGFASDLSIRYGISVEQIGLKAGMICTSIFAMLGIIIVLLLIRFFKKNSDHLKVLVK
jgi:fucose permease